MGLLLSAAKPPLSPQHFLFTDELYWMRYCVRSAAVVSRGFVCRGLPCNVVITQDAFLPEAPVFDVCPPSCLPDPDLD